MEGKNRKTKVFKWAAMVMLAVSLVFTGCPHTAGSGSGGGGISTPAGSYNAATGEGIVGGVKFTMKKVEDVTDGSVGHTNEDDNQPHTVSLTAYRIGESEVTQELWQAVMGGNPSYFTDSLKNPVELVNWYACIAFCNELTKKAGLGDRECVYYTDSGFGTVYTTSDANSGTVPQVKWSAKGFRLPTEAEWEWAAKGGTENKWAGTNTESELVNYAWYNDSKTHEVKLKSPNGYGLYDMSGNVWEWCWDQYKDSTPTGGQDPTGAASGDARVERGGGWGDGASNATRADRYGIDPGDSYTDLGVRVVSRP
ncbi:SUMF1/EgtB/PvdO family nonheme iron enzyme [Treponema sp. OMZ 857]|uniref:formylglycine-generating enzyme family protein n=1 Tax=Treponema sp. OMZ 857 TaxID=1643513 RepID=UPI0020A5D4BD|nr:SUMF1/EgtB/PvdO family nonheme iron enzyme [Treponema sp. OMZ 857]UTC44010.1 formylglycine-generating enzyme family protein [Treponema sp. OMZ 857]